MGGDYSGVELESAGNLWQLQRLKSRTGSGVEKLCQRAANEGDARDGGAAEGEGECGRGGASGGRAINVIKFNFDKLLLNYATFDVGAATSLAAQHQKELQIVKIIITFLPLCVCVGVCAVVQLPQ